MLSLLLALTIFLFVMVLGKALLVAFRVGLPVLLGWLVAPSLGTALVITAVVNLNQCDVPVGRFGPTLLITLLVFIAVVFLWRRPRFPWPYLGFFLLTAVFSLFYTGWPALINGFKWLSYGNDDMANYCVAATRFLHQGFYTLPTYRAIDGLDYSQDYWFMHVQDLMRPGSEEFLAWIASVTGLHPMHIFMPTALAFSFCQIFAAASLILCISIQYRRLALLAATLLAISPLFSLGTLYQLITQQIGIGLLCASLSLIVWVCLQCRFSWPRLVLTALLVNGLCLFYPEVAPFFVLSLVLFIGVWTVKSRLVAARLVIRVALIGLLTFILLNKNLAMFLITMLSQSHGAASTGVTGERFVLFPWSLVPSSWAMLWGFIPFGRLWTEPFNSIAIAWGILYFAVVIVFALLALKRAQIWSCLLVVMAALGFWLFHIDQDFGLFKLHMYIQPALMVGLAAVVVAYFRSTRALVGAVAVFFLATCWTQNKYTAASAGIINSGLNEIQGVSRLGMDFPVPSDFHDRFFLLENSNPTLAKLTCSLLKGCPTKMIGRDVFNSISGGTAESRQFDLETWRVNSYLPEDMVLKADVIARQLKIMRTSGDDLVRLKSALSPIVPKEVFAEPPRPQDLIKHMFDTDFIDVSESFSGYPERTTIVSGPSEYEQFNKFNPPSYQPNDSFVRFTPLTDIHNYLVFIHTPRGSHYYSGGRLNASFFQREPDCFDSNYYFNGMGRFTLFRVLQPTPNFRLRIMLTRTIMGSGRNQLPPQATLTGDSVHSIPWIGSGSSLCYYRSYHTINGWE